MCGACGGGGRAGPAWEDAAGRPDVDGRRARARAVRRLLDGTRWKAEPWHSGWVVTGPTGQRHHAADLDALFALLPAPALPTAGDKSLAAAAPRSGWHVQAGLVWVAAARSAGLEATVLLPDDAGGRLQLRLPGNRTPVETRHEPAAERQIEVECSSAEAVLASLLTVAGG